MKKLLITTMGIPGSGKSHFAKQLAKEIGAVRLNSDSMRNSVFDNPMDSDPDGVKSKSFNKIVFGAIDYATKQVLDAGYSVIYDAKVNRVSERLKNADIANSSGATPITVWVKVADDVAIERTQTREITLDQGKLTPTQRTTRNSDYLEEPSDTELFILINGTDTFTNQLNDFISQLGKFL